MVPRAPKGERQAQALDLARQAGPEGMTSARFSALVGLDRASAAVLLNKLGRGGRLVRRRTGVAREVAWVHPQHATPEQIAQSAYRIKPAGEVAATQRAGRISSAQRRAQRANNPATLDPWALMAPAEPLRPTHTAVEAGVTITRCDPLPDHRYSVGPDFKGGQFMDEWRRRTATS